jgi:XTP/dITP diphosphohydrolase
MAQLTPEEKNKISHRGKAVSKLVEILKKVL